MTGLDLVNLDGLMKLTTGNPDVVVGIVDGPVAVEHPDLAGNIRTVNPSSAPKATPGSDPAFVHGTFVAGILGAKRGSLAPAICPGCTLVVQGIFRTRKRDLIPQADAEDVAGAMEAVMKAGARVINMSAAVLRASTRGEGVLNAAIAAAVKRGVIVVVAAGNQGLLTSSTLTRHPWVIPVAACDSAGRATPDSNLGSSIGVRGVLAPGRDITSLAAGGGTMISGGTSAATPFVSGTIALLWSQFPEAHAEELRLAISPPQQRSARSIVPPLLNAEASYRRLAAAHSRPGVKLGTRP